METDKVAASGSSTLTQAELSALLNAAIAAKREQERLAATSIPVHAPHWGNTDYGRIIGAGGFVACVCAGIGILCGGVALILAALR